MPPQMNDSVVESDLARGPRLEFIKAIDGQTSANPLRQTASITAKRTDPDL